MLLQAEALCTAVLQHRNDLGWVQRVTIIVDQARLRVSHTLLCVGVNGHYVDNSVRSSFAWGPTLSTLHSHTLYALVVQHNPISRALSRGCDWPASHAKLGCDWWIQGLGCRQCIATQCRVPLSRVIMCSACVCYAHCEKGFSTLYTWYTVKHISQ